VRGRAGLEVVVKVMKLLGNKKAGPKRGAALPQVGGEKIS